MDHGLTLDAQAAPASPWGLLPHQLRVLYIATPRRTGGWLAEAFASDSACRVTLDEAQGPADGLARLRDQTFDAVLVSHEPGELDALELVEALRSSGGEEPTIVLGQMSEQEMAALCFEVGADAYVCAGTATTRMLLWVVARATEHRRLIRENRRLAEVDRHRRQQDSSEAERLLDEQRGLVRDADRPRDASCGQLSSDALAALGGQPSQQPPLNERLVRRYRQLLKAHVMMGSGNLGQEMDTLADELAADSASPAQTLQLHVEALEELVRDLGSRGARHVMSRGDLLVLEVLVQLADRYRTRALAATLDAPGAAR